MKAKLPASTIPECTHSSFTSLLTIFSHAISPPSTNGDHTTDIHPIKMHFCHNIIVRTPSLDILEFCYYLQLVFHYQ